MFLSAVSAISAAPWRGIHVVTKVARFRRALPSRNSSLVMRSCATSLPVPRHHLPARGNAAALASRMSEEAMREASESLGVLVTIPSNHRRRLVRITRSG
jgi:hypothetical protein